ncbi:hypothetical protein SLEP1_g25956 [Rubroshorea leprosula]|uniref:Uncharacterized protein n=1 Tax=Rubroshorea leprosula TaxID=152421 RepID=A0AAV5JKS0_9ROSI|nr:hypothetical protein SLEP1_g25956 [Rubroshorea leprosula]
MAAKCRKLSCAEAAELPRDQACCRAAKGRSNLMLCFSSSSRFSPFLCFKKEQQLLVEMVGFGGLSQLATEGHGEKVGEGLLMDYVAPSRTEHITELQ